MDTEVKEFTVIPWGVPSASVTVAMATPVANFAHICRKVTASIIDDFLFSPKRRIRRLDGPEYLYTLAIDFGDVEPPFGVGCHQMRKLEGRGIAPLGQGFPRIQRKMRHAVCVAIGDQQLVAYHMNAKRITEAGPGGKKVAPGIEDLDAMVVAVGNVDAVAGVDSEGVGSCELACPFAVLAPRAEEFPVRRDTCDAAVARIGDVDVACCREHQVVGRAEAQFAGFTDRKQESAFVRELTKKVVPVVGSPEVASAIDAKAMGDFEQPLTEGADVFAILVELEDRLWSSMQDIDTVLAIDGDGAHRADFNMRRQREETDGNKG